MTKGELIRSLEALMDETEVVVGTQSLTGIWDILRADYMKSRDDEPAYVRLAIRGSAHNPWGKVLKTYKVLLPDTWVTVQAENEEEAALAALAKLLNELTVKDLVVGGPEGIDGGSEHG